MRCRICQEQLQGFVIIPWRHQHYRSLHPEYARWFKLWLRNFYLLVFLFIVAMIVTEYLWLTMGGFYGDAALITIVSFIALCIYEVDYLFLRGRRRFFREWKDQHNPNL